MGSFLEPGWFLIRVRQIIPGAQLKAKCFVTSRWACPHCLWQYSLCVLHWVDRLSLNHFDREAQGLIPRISKWNQMSSRRKFMFVNSACSNCNGDIIGWLANGWNQITQLWECQNPNRCSRYCVYRYYYTCWLSGSPIPACLLARTVHMTSVSWYQPPILNVI